MKNEHGLNIFFLLLFVGFILLYVSNIDGWLMDDDEGTNFYEVWQLQQGQEPGVDFIAEQQPLFLIVGKGIIDIWGRDPIPLRLVAVFHILVGAGILALAIRKVLGNTAAILTFVFILGSGMIFDLARLFRPDPMMLAWEMIGLGAVILAVNSNDKRWWAAAGLAYGVGVLWKPFGIFPIIGLVFYFLYLLWRQPNQRLELIRAGLYFSLPFLFVSIGGLLLLYANLGFYYLEPLAQHLGLGQENSLLFRAKSIVYNSIVFLLANSVFLFTLPLLWLNSPLKRPRPELPVLLTQLVTPAIFFLFTRPLHTRYLFHLIPVLAIVTAWQFRVAFEKIKRSQPSFSSFVPVTLFIIMIYVFFTTRPGLLFSLLREETGTLALANFVATNTQTDELVLSDYAGINFFAARSSIYEASIIAGAQVEGQVVDASLLIDRLDSERVEMVLIHTEGGDPPPHQLSALVRFDLFQAYLDDQFKLLTVFDRAGQQIEIYERQ